MSVMSVMSNRHYVNASPFGDKTDVTHLLVFSQAKTATPTFFAHWFVSTVT